MATSEKKSPVRKKKAAVRKKKAVVVPEELVIEASVEESKSEVEVEEVLSDSGPEPTGGDDSQPAPHSRHAERIIKPKRKRVVSTLWTQ